MGVVDGLGLFIDSCAVNRFALINFDPIAELAGSEFRLAVTPDLEIEYQQALEHVSVPSYVKDLIRKLLDRCERRGFFGFGGPPCAGFGEGSFVSREATAAIAEVPIRSRATNTLPRNRTDSHLIGLSMTNLVITADVKQVRRWGANRPGLISWQEFEVYRDAGRCLIELMRLRAAALPGRPMP